MTIPTLSELAWSYCIILNNEGVALIRDGKLKDAREVLQAASSLHQLQISKGSLNRENYHIRQVNLSNEIETMSLWWEDRGFAFCISKVTNESTCGENNLDGFFTARIDRIINYNLALATCLQFLVSIESLGAISGMGFHEKSRYNNKDKLF